MDGGYYRYDFEEGAPLSVIGLNTIYYHWRNKYDLDGGDRQLDWLKLQLASAEPGRRFILMMHVFPGLFYLD